MKRRMIALYMSILAFVSSGNFTKINASDTDILPKQTQSMPKRPEKSLNNTRIKLQNPFLTPTFSLFSNLKRWENEKKREIEEFNKNEKEEKDYITIGSFNTKDNQINRQGGVREDGTDNAEILANQIKENKFDYLGTQELTLHYVNNLKGHLKNYKFYGNYRYGKLLVHMPYNENNMILTNQDVITSETVQLPWIADNWKDLKTSVTQMSIMPRIATIVITKDAQNREVCMINTHLDYQVPSIQLRQLKELKNLINKYQEKYPIILTGDFNMELTNPAFQQFVTENQDILQHVDIAEPTWHGQNGEAQTLDHIFVPASWHVIDSGVIDSMDTSDHNMIFAKVKVK